MKGNSNHRTLWIIAAIYILINVLQSFFMPLINDEAYYWVWSQNLDWGYFDHPPMVALWASLGFSIFQNELGVRLIAVLFGGIGYVVLGKLLNLQNKSQLALYSYLFFSIVLFQAFGFINTPDAPLLFFGILYLYLLKNFFHKNSVPNAIFLGIAMSLLIYSKYHGILLIAFSLLPHVFKLIKNKYFYIAVIAGVVCYIPHMWWQFENEFISLQYHLVKRDIQNLSKWNYSTDYILSLIWAGSPLIFLYHIKALFKSKYKTNFEKSLLWSFAGIIGFFILISFRQYIQAQWSLVAFIPMLIITFNYYKNNSKAIQWIKYLSITTMVIIGFARVYFIIQDVPVNTQYHGWKRFMIKVGEVSSNTAVFEKYQYTSLFNFYNYPDKQAHNYKTLENRDSQYNLWNSELNLNGQDITYFSKYIDSQDSLILEKDNPQAIFYYKDIKNYTSTANVKILIQDAVLVKDSLKLKVAIQNPNNWSLTVSRENDMAIKYVQVDRPFSNTVLCIKTVPYEPFVVAPNSTKTIDLIVKHCSNTLGTAVSYLSIVHEALPPKKQSEYIESKLKL